MKGSSPVVSVHCHLHKQYAECTYNMIKKIQNGSISVVFLTGNSLLSILLHKNLGSIILINCFNLKTSIDNILNNFNMSFDP